MLRPRRSAVLYRFVRRKPTPVPAAVLVPGPPPPSPGVGTARYTEASPWLPDGMIWPRPQDSFFDVVVRNPTLAPGATVQQLAFVVEEGFAGGWIRKLGYSYNNPQGFFMVQTFVLINGGPPGRYLFKTVDAAAPGAAPYTGSLPTEQIGSIQRPAKVYIQLPSNARVEVRFVNINTEVTFNAAVRLWGWFSGR